MVDNPNLVPQEAYDAVVDPYASNVTNLRAFDAVEKAAPLILAADYEKLADEWDEEASRSSALGCVDEAVIVRAKARALRLRASELRSLSTKTGEATDEP